MIFTLIFIIYCAHACLAEKDIALPTDYQPGTFVVLELFTSQGCSSCPAADSQLRMIQKRAQEKDLPVFTLSFHVDYWDYLGWKDIFSDQIYTARQHQYARAFSRRNIYTPQMVLNGTDEFVGSDGSKTSRLIRDALEKKKTENVLLKGSYSDNGSVFDLDYQVDPAYKGYLNVALVQGEAEVDIKRGENTGRKISYSSIVRRFVRLDCKENSQGHVQIKKPQDLAGSSWKIVLYLQNKNDMKIIAVSKALPVAF